MTEPDVVSKPAIVLLSGGLDSATTLAIARDAGYECHALSFNYGQRHRFELDAARNVAAHLDAVEHLLMKIDLRAFGGSALTDDIDVPKETSKETDSRQPTAESPTAIPITYVPARNTIFLSFALGFAEVRGATDIFIGVNAVDYSGYPDCRPEFIAAFECTANLATRIGVEHAARHENPIRVHAPLINMTKAQIIERGTELGVDFAMTHSCYDPDAATGEPCGACDSCIIRAAGFREAGLNDPELARVR